MLLTQLTRPSCESASRVKLRAVDYDDKFQLIEALQGVHKVLSFFQLMADPGNIVQKNLINAAIVAGVKRFAPSEWGR